MSTVARAPLVAVAHGSRDPRSAATIGQLSELARRMAPDVPIRQAFLDLSSPAVGDTLGELHAAGHSRMVTAPLLLGSAYHARTDLPAIVDKVTATRPGLNVDTTDVLGIDPLLEDVALDRLRATGVDTTDPQLGIVLAAVGSSHPPANDAVHRMARRWQRDLGGPSVAAAFASTATPDVPAAVARLRARGARSVAVASWFLAPGLLPDRVEALARQAAADVRVAAPLGVDPRVARVLLDRYDTACGHRLHHPELSARVSA